MERVFPRVCHGHGGRQTTWLSIRLSSVFVLDTIRRRIMTCRSFCGAIFVVVVACLAIGNAPLPAWSEREWLVYDPARSGSPQRDEAGDPTGDHHQLYTSGVQPYPRSPGLLVGLPERYSDRGWTRSTERLPDRDVRRARADKGIAGGRPTRWGTVITDVLFRASHDGRRFFVWPEAFVRPGIQRPGTWYYGGARLRRNGLALSRRAAGTFDLRAGGVRPADLREQAGRGSPPHALA